MPTSYMQTIPLILELVQHEKPTSILDVGVGFGKYGVLLRELLDVPHQRYHPDSWQVRIEGVEGCEVYRTPIHDHVYDAVHYGDVRALLDGLPVYDVVLLIDVLEHFDRDEGEEVLRKLLAHARKALIVSTPLNPTMEQTYLDNDLERHRSRWTVIDFQRFEFAIQRLFFLQ